MKDHCRYQFRKKRPYLNPLKEQKQRNKKIVEHFSQQENIDWISELNKNASAKGKTIVTHVSQVFIFINR